MKTVQEIVTGKRRSFRAFVNAVLFESSDGDEVISVTDTGYSAESLYQVSDPFMPHPNLSTEGEVNAYLHKTYKGAQSVENIRSKQKNPFHRIQPLFMKMPPINPQSYDKYIVAFSGGKDSTACALHLLKIGIPVSKIELWHHDIDGDEETFFDWECTPDYCRKFADAFGFTIYFSGRQGGFLREMLRSNSLTAPVYFETPNDGVVVTQSKDNPKYYNTRLKFPQISASLSTRWCSSYLKIDVCATAIRNQKRFETGRTLVISGERGEESTARSKYETFEIDRSGISKPKNAPVRRSSKRWVDRWRPIKDWTEAQVWEIIEEFRVRVHPAYYMGWGRVSCKFCIFGNKNQFASAYLVSPKQGETIIDHESAFGVTMKRNIDLRSLIKSGEPYEGITDKLMTTATSYIYDESIILENWTLPKGAYGESCGPT